MSAYQPNQRLLDKGKNTSSHQHEAGDIIIEHLRELDVEYVFGIPGGAIEPLFSALARSMISNGPKAIIARHEAGAVFMADGYARESGKLGVCIGTSGPGATNMITGIISAYQDKTPILVITGQPPINTFGSLAFQESTCTGIDVVAMFKHCTAYSSLVSHPDQLERKLVAAITAAYQQQRPVHLSIPMDIASSKHPALPNRRLLPPCIKHNGIDLETTGFLAQELSQAANPVFVIGEGCKEAIGSIINYCEQSGASIVTTPQGKGLINPYHPNFYGVCGLAGHESATDLLNSKKIDLIVIVGSALDQQSICGWQPSDRDLYRVIHVDSNAEHFCRSQYAILNVLGNIKLVFSFLNKSIKAINVPSSQNNQTSSKINNKPVPFERRRTERRKQNALHLRDQRNNERRNITTLISPLTRNFHLQDELKYLDDSSPIKPQHLMHELSRRAPNNTRFLADIGNSYLWAIHYLNPRHKMDINNSNYLYMGMGFASMAWSLGAAIGVALAAPKKPVICILGDGAMLMSAHELTVAVQYNLPIIYIVLNDQAYGMVKHGQKMSAAESTGTELPPVNFAIYAQSIGANGITIKSSHDLDTLDFYSLSQSNRPTIIDIYIDVSEPPPLSDRLKMLASSRN